MTVTEKQVVYLPKVVSWEGEGVYFFLDPDSPHWIAVDSRGSRILRGIEEALQVGEMICRYAAAYSMEMPKAWLHVHEFLQALLRCGFARPEPWKRQPYQGRAAYARGGGNGAASASGSHARSKNLKELWLHTNNICNLSCEHCLVGSAPWVKDWGLPTERLLELVNEAVELGVDRFYLTGGEPFMRKDLVEILRAITEAKQAEAIVLTNAILLKSQWAQDVRTLRRDKIRFQVSLDGATAQINDRIRGVGSFEKTLAGLHWLNDQGFETSLTTVVTRSNLKELTALTRLCRQAGTRSQHLMWLHRRGRVLEGNGNSDGFPSVEELLEAVWEVRRVAAEEGVLFDNWESIKRRANGRPGVKYDLGNACWDSLCVYSDGRVYPSAATANFRPLALGSVGGESSLRRVWERSPIAKAFRQASVVEKSELADEPFRYLTGGGDIEHSFWFNLNGESASSACAPERLREILRGPDPYYPLYVAMMREAMAEIAGEKQKAVNRRSGYDVPRVLHAMGQGAIHCATDDLAVTGEVDVRTLHSNCVLAFDVEKPRALVREFYAKAAAAPVAELCCPTAFDPSMISHIPQGVVDRFYGCGSPVTMADLREGETMVDLGSGAGIDCFIAAKRVGPKGRIIGIDMTEEMLKVANENRSIVAENLGYEVVEFRKGYLEQVPVEQRSADLVTSNCVINLSPDKPKVFAEIWKILKDHGRLVVADIVSDRPLPANLKVNPQLWGECTVGALTEAEFLAELEAAGFYGLSLLKKTYWKTIEGFDFYSVTVAGYKFEKSQGCRFIGQQAIYLGPMKAVVDEEGHLFPRNAAVEICADTAAKLSNPPYAGLFAVLEPDAVRQEGLAVRRPIAAAECGPGCC